MQPADTLLSPEAQRIIDKAADPGLPAFDRCYAASDALQTALTAGGVTATLVQFAGLLRPAPEADPRWHRVPASSWSHYAVLIGGTVVDLTRRQFFPDAAFPHVAPLAEERALWARCYR